MTPNQLQTRLARLYGPRLSRWGLCKAFADDAGIHPDTVQKWFNGVNPLPKWVGLALEALQTRKG